ncbi:polyprenyl synthetase family protein [Embleya sp. NPDC020886]|uniref:polyprenyl synthetase family protein n=1 Tax=Embleya sp. NPDC020886 TaxID=3363980 RepID=UPI0037935F98
MPMPASLSLDCPRQAGRLLLTRARRIVDPELRRCISGLPPGVRRPAEYHMGWQDERGHPGEAGGKALRPALVFAAAAAVGGTAEMAMPAAVAVELVHNFTLLHDDVMDRDTMRHGRATAWKVFGTTNAVLAGNALQALASHVLAEGPAEHLSMAQSALTTCEIELCEGQYQDCSFEQRTDVSLHECLSMAEGKTGSLLGSACALGARYGGGTEAQARCFDRFGRAIGVAFQLLDDILGIWGDPAITGKPVYADLAARKKSLPVVAALRSGAPCAHELAELYSRPGRLSLSDLAHAARLIDRCGGRSWSLERATGQLHEASGHLARSGVDPSAAGDLLALADLTIRRSH